jgi:two-component system OmpR family response regulator
MSGSSTKHLLVVDDEPVIRELVAYYLKNEGYTFSFAHDGEDGIRQFRENVGSIDAVISDWNMPGMTGDEMAAGIKEAAADVPVLLISGYAGTKLDRTCFDGYLPKPFTKDRLIAALKSAVESAGRRAQRSLQQLKT